jgi:hypothetical protein
VELRQLHALLVHDPADRSDGSPFRATAAFPDLFVAPNWVWILSFTVFGLVIGAAYAALRSPDRLAGDDATADGS